MQHMWALNATTAAAATDAPAVRQFTDQKSTTVASIA